MESRSMVLWSRSLKAVSSNESGRRMLSEGITGSEGGWSEQRHSETGEREPVCSAV